MTTSTRKLSDILKEMSEQLLRNPDGPHSCEAASVALMFANMAWDETVGLGCPWEDYRPTWESIEAENPNMWSEFKSTDVNAMLDSLAAYKRKYFPDDQRRILVCGIPEGKIHVEWLEPVAPGVDSKWEMRLYGLVRAGYLDKAMDFVQETRGLSFDDSAMEVAKTVAKLGLKWPKKKRRRK